MEVTQFTVQLGDGFTCGNAGVTIDGRLLVEDRILVEIQTDDEIIQFPVRLGDGFVCGNAHVTFDEILFDEQSIGVEVESHDPRPENATPKPEYETPANRRKRRKLNATMC